MAGYVYMMTNRPRGVLYVGVTSDLPARIYQHREGAVAGFTARYRLRRVVWFEVHDRIEEAIRREKQIKRWRRDWTIVLIEDANPHWSDL